MMLRQNAFRYVAMSPPVAKTPNVSLSQRLRYRRIVF
jgi:hypothetical protein